MLSALRLLFRLAGGSGHPANAAPPAPSTAPEAEGVAPAVAAGATFRPTDFTFVGPGGSRHMPAADLQDRAERAAALFRHTLTGRRIGLVFRSEPSLVVAWLGLVSAGFEPLILQYPTEKQNRAVWTGSIANSIQVAALDRILCAPDVVGLLADLADAHPVPFTLDDLAAHAPDAPFAFRADAIIQLSSGTTGHRKAIAFTRDQVAHHLNDYNAVMGLGSGDVCVSWLPLYHDMGFIACFLMPMLLGLPVVMIDPIDWVRQPGLLFEAIAAHRGTYCYMPNFGYEIMAKQRTGAPGAGLGTGLATIRRWVSCSEPVYADTARRFLAAHAIPAERFAACYAMAENVFAVTQSDGLVVVEADGVEQVSCGTPIPGVELAIRDGQIHVRSATAVQAYLGGAQVADERGFYPTGDLGHVAAEGPGAGGLVVTGRSGDVLNIAGKKYMLNDLDYAVNQAFPAAKGRAAALASHNPRLGTEQLLVLAESQDFYLRDDAAAVAAAVAERTGVEAVDVHYVPPGFITKTSSGKINRKKTAADWAAARAFQAAGSAGPGGDGRPLAAVIAELFPKAPRDVPLGEAFDSLGLTVVRMLLEERGLTLSAGLTVADLDAAGADRRAPIADSLEDGRPGDPQTEHQIRVFNLGDPTAFQGLTIDYFEDLSRKVGVQVTYEQFCAPPAAVLLNDLIFHDYFMVRDPRGLAAYERLSNVLKAIKKASLIIFDDYAEYFRARQQFVPGLDHKFMRDPAAGLLAWRFQRYTWDHHLHPIRIIPPQEAAADIEGSLERLSSYLGLPIFRVAFQNTKGRKTSAWEHVFGAYDPRLDLYVDEKIGFDEVGVARSLGGYIAANVKTLTRANDANGLRYTIEMFHFCADLISDQRINSLISRHERFLIYGPNSSLLHLRNEIEKRGKFYKQIMNWETEGAPFVGDFDCIVETGSWTPAQLPVEIPIYQVFWAGYTEITNTLQDGACWFYKRVETDELSQPATNSLLSDTAPEVVLNTYDKHTHAVLS